MPSVPAAELPRELRSLDDRELAAFVADLWAARGFETSIEGTIVSAERGAESTTIQCGPRSEADGIDILVRVDRESTARDSAGVRILGSESLRQMLLYAVDRTTADRLCRRHLGRSLSAAPDRTPRRARLAGVPVTRLLAVGFVLLVSAATVLGAAGDGGILPSDRTPDLPATTPVGTPGPSPTTGTDSGLPAAGGQLFRYPPGVGATGVTDAGALAAAHRHALAYTSWRLRLTHDGSHDLMHPYREWVGSTQVVVRASPTRYTYQVTGFERADNETFPAEIYVDYGDGAENYRRHIGVVGDGFQVTTLPATEPPGLFATLSATYIERYLATTRSQVESVRAGPTTRQRVIATGTPTGLARSVANYTAVAVIDRRGVVHRLVVEYTLLRREPAPEANGIATPYAPIDRVPTEPVGTVRFEMVLSGLDAANFSPPGWHDRARNATAGDAPAPWPNDPAI